MVPKGQFRFLGKLGEMHRGSKTYCVLHNFTIVPVPYHFAQTLQCHYENLKVAHRSLPIHHPYRKSAP
jgi:hypothetical protein